MRYLKVPYYKQVTPYTCGPAALHMVCAYYNLLVTEQELADEMHTSPRTGTENEALVEAAQRRKLHCYVNDHSSIEEIFGFVFSKVPSIVNFIEPSNNEGHYGVVIGVSPSVVVIHDPWNGKRIRFNHPAFLERWRNSDGHYMHWIMAVTKDARAPEGQKKITHEH